MMRTVFNLIGFIVVSLVGSATIHADALGWQPVSVGLGDTNFIAVAAHPIIPARLMAASRHSVYESSDGGQSWQERFHPPLEVSITALAVASSASTILAATDHGVYGSFDGGAHWSRVFQGADEGERQCTHVAFHPHHTRTALLGTHGGLFMSLDEGRHWTQITIPPSANDVVHFAFDPQDADRVHLLTTDRLFVGSVSQGRWQQRMSVLNAASGEAAELEQEDVKDPLEPERATHRLRAVAVDPNEPAHIYLATSRGLQESIDGGLTWHRLSRTGLESASISRVLLQTHSPLVLYAATGRGVARFTPADNRWEPLTTGLTTRQVNDLAATAGHMWAATEEGLYRYEIPPLETGQTPPPSARELLANFVHEPTITHVQETAIRYAEVHPEKIRRWRRQAALKALLPVVDVGMNHGVTQNFHVDEGTFPHFQLIDTKDRKAGLDLSVKWDLGNLIWNSEQTSIDLRSKLMVQLRDELLDEVTRTYFERRRLQILLLVKAPTDQQTVLEQELHLQELTAMLDGLTGGYFSKQLRVLDQP